MKTAAPRRKSPSSPGEGQFDDYEERFVSLERHQRVVHYYLRRNGKETLAVVGTEKSPRHLNYVVQAAFLEAVGLSPSGELIKWRTRREVLEWLDTFVKEPKGGHGQPPSFEERATGKFKKQKKLSSAVVGKLPRRPAESWLGDDGRTHFSSVNQKGTTIAAHDFVRIAGVTGSEKVAYVEDLAQAEGEEVVLEVRWLQPADSLHAKRLLLTDSTDEVPIADVAGPAAVLTEAHWDRFSPSLPEAQLKHVYFSSGGPTGPSIQALKGYWTQRHAAQVLGDGVLSSLKPPRKRPADLPPSSPPQLSSASRFSSDLSWGGVPKKKRFSGSYAEDDVESTPPIRKKRRRVPGDPPRRLGRPPKLLTSAGGAVSPKPIHGGTKRVQGSPTTRGFGGFGGFAVGDAVETLSEDSGLRGCWFRGKVVAVAAPRRLKIRYDELDDEEAGGKLEEWVTVSRSSAKDSLNLRASGRSKVRPRPPKPALPVTFCPGTAVEAWWNDGWWEGVVSTEQEEKFEVFFPGEGDSAWFHPTDLRPSKEWLEGAWKEVPGLKDVAGLMNRGIPEAMCVENDSDEMPKAGAKLEDTGAEVKAEEGPCAMEVDDGHSPGTPAVCEPQKSAAVLALSSFPREKPSLLRTASGGGGGVRKLGPSNLGRSSAPLTSPPVGGGLKEAAGKHERFECLEKIEDEDEPANWGGFKGGPEGPPDRSVLPAGGEQSKVRTPRFDIVPTPAGKEHVVWTSPSPSPSCHGSLPPPAQKWESPANALESEQKAPPAEPEGGAAVAQQVPASRLAEMDPNSEVKEAACELPRPVIAVKRAEMPARASAAQQSCSVDAGPPKPGHPQPILSR